MAMRLGRLLRVFRRRGLGVGLSPAARQDRFRAFVDEQRARTRIGFRRTRTRRTREAVKHSAWVAFKRQHVGDGHRAAPKVALVRLRSVFEHGQRS